MKKSIKTSRKDDMNGALAALKRAAKRAREIAKQAGAHLHVWQNGKVVALA